MNRYEPDLLQLPSDVGRMLRTEADRCAKVHGTSRAGWVIRSRLERQLSLSQIELAGTLEAEPITGARLVDRLGLRGPSHLWAGTTAQVFVFVCSQAMLQRLAKHVACYVYACERTRTARNPTD